MKKNYNLHELIEPESINVLLELFYKTTGFVTAILDLEGNVLAKSGWRDICTLFHRVHPETSKKCTESDTVLANPSSDGEKFHAYNCLNGLVDVAVPIMIEGKRVGTLYTGQFLTEEPDLDFFRKQAAHYGFDERKYLETLQKVPVVTEEEANTAMEFLYRMIEQFLDKTLQKIKKEEAEEKFRTAFKGSPDAISISRLDDGVFLEVNEGFIKLLGYSSEEIIGESAFKINLWANLKDRDRAVIRLKEDGFVSNFETSFQKKSGEIFPALLSASIINIEGKNCVFVIARDIGEQKKAEEQLRLSEEKFRLAFQSNPDARVMTRAKDGKIFDVNDAFTTIMGFTRDEALGKTTTQLKIWTTGEDRERLVNAMKKSGTVQNMETHLRTKSGKIINGLMSATIITINNEPCIISMMRDITDLKKAEDSLRKTTSQLESIYDSVHDVIFYLGIEPDENYRFLSVNRAFLSATGLKREQVEGKLVDEVIPEPSLTLAKDKYKKAIEEKSMVEWEETTPYPEGLKYGIVNVVPLFDDSGICSHLVGSVHDITEIKNAEEELRASEEKYRLIDNASIDFIYSYDKEGRFTHVNNSLIKFFGRPRQEIIGKTHRELGFPETVCKEWDTLDRNVYETNTTVISETSILLPGGEIRYYEVTLNPLHDHQNSIIGIAGVTRDITERKLAEEKIKSSEANLMALINNREDYIWSLDRDYRYIAFNTTYADMFYNHYKTECKKGLRSLDFLTEDEKEFWVGVCERAFTGEHVKFEYSYDLGKGMQYFQTSINPIYEEKEITGLSLISVEITDQVRITQRFKALFEYAPVPLWEEDFSGVKKIIDGLKKRGVKNFRKYFDTHPEVLEKCIRSVKLLEVNQPVLWLHEADSKEELLAGLDKIFTDESVIGFKEELIAIAEGNSTAQFDSKVKTLKGNERDIHLIWNVVPGYEETLERIYVSTEDITERKKAEEELRLSRERLIRAQRIAKMGDFTWDVDTGEVTWSEGLFELLKYDKNDKIDYAKVNAEIHHPDDLERVTQWLNEAVASGKDVLPPNEYRIIRKDGETIYIRTEGVFDRSGGKTKLFVTLYDITEQKKAETRLKEHAKRLEKQEQLLRTMAENYPNSFLSIIDRNQRVVLTSGQELKRQGLTPEMFYNLTVEEVFQPYGEEVLNKIKDAYKKSFNGIAQEFELFLNNQYQLYRTIPLPDEKGEIDRIMVVAENITERKLAEEEIKTINKRLTDILENMSDAFVALDRNWCYTYMNEKAAKIFNRNAKEIIGKHIWTEFPEGVRQPFHLNYEKAMNERVFIQMEEYYPPYDKWFENRINPTNEGIAIFFSDITKRKKTEKELQRLNEELHILNRDLEKRVLERTAELRNANRELEEFAYSISHDLRAPLRSISGFSEIIATRYKATLNEEALKYFEFILEASKNMANLIDDLLRFSRMTKKEIIKKPVSLTNIFNNVLQDLHMDISNKNAEIMVPENLPSLHGDKSLLTQIFSNLLINAITYTRQGVRPTVEISAWEEGQDIIIAMKDNGIGIPAAYHEKIFTIFQRLHTQKDYPGTGIGLALVKKAVTMLDGSIRLESQVGQGTTFYVSFPKI